MEKGEQRRYIIRCYLAPDKASTIDIIAAELREISLGAKFLVMGNFNDVIESPKGADWEEEIAVASMIAVLEDT